MIENYDRANNVCSKVSSSKKKFTAQVNFCMKKLSTPAVSCLRDNLTCKNFHSWIFSSLILFYKAEDFSLLFCQNVLPLCEEHPPKLS